MTKLIAQCNIFKNISAFNSARFLSLCHSVYFKKLYRAGDRRVPHNSKTNDEQILTALNSCRMAQSEKGFGFSFHSLKWCRKKNLQQQRRGSNPFIQLSTLFEIIGSHKVLPVFPILAWSATLKKSKYFWEVCTTPIGIKELRTESDFRARLKSILNSTVWDFKFLVTEIVNCILSSECLDKMCYITES